MRQNEKKILVKLDTCNIMRLNVNGYDLIFDRFTVLPRICEIVGDGLRIGFCSSICLCTVYGGRYDYSARFIVRLGVA